MSERNKNLIEKLLSYFFLTCLYGSSMMQTIRRSADMPNERSREKLLNFIDYLANRGLMAKATANSRRAAASKVLGILSTEEAEDVTSLNLDEVMSRFQNLEGQGYTPSSLATYRSRVKSAVEDFNRYLNSPLGFKPSVGKRERPKSETSKSASATPAEQTKNSTGTRPTSPPMSNSIVPIPIRQDVTVYVQGLPFDLSQGEAERIANVIRAMATPV